MKNRKLDGYRTKLIDLLDEELELFIEERTFLLKEEVTQTQILHPEYKPKWKTETELKHWRRQLQLETNQLLDSLEREYSIEEVQKWFKPTQLNIEEEYDFREHEKWLADPSVKLFFSDLDQTEEALKPISQADLVARCNNKMLAIDK